MDSHKIYTLYSQSYLVHRISWQKKMKAKINAPCCLRSSYCVPRATCPLFPLSPCPHRGPEAGILTPSWLRCTARRARKWVQLVHHIGNNREVKNTYILFGDMEQTGAISEVSARCGTRVFLRLGSKKHFLWTLYMPCEDMCVPSVVYISVSS